MGRTAGSAGGPSVRQGASRVRSVASRVHRTVRAVFAGLAAALGLIGTSVAFGLVVLVPSVLHRVSFSDPLWAPRRHRSTWVSRSGGDRLRSGDLFLPDPASRSAIARRRRRRLLLVAAVSTPLLVVAGPSVWPSLTDRLAGFATSAGASSATAFSPAAMARIAPLPPRPDEQPEWAEAWRAAYAEAVAGAQLTSSVGVRLADVESATLDISAGVRRSWVPPAPARCERTRVWIFGGSAAFGLLHRDGHTVASELARVAWRDGVALDVSNRAVPGDVAFIERRRLEEALAFEPPPDLVVFLDGYEDLRAVRWGLAAGRSPAVAPLAPTDRELTGYVNELVGEESSDGLEYTVDAATGGRDAPPATVARAAAEQYDRAASETSVVLAARAIPSVRFLQPLDEPTGDDAATRFRDALASDVVDLTGRLDTDLVEGLHVSERGTRLLASAMWEDALRRIDAEDCR